LDSVCVDAPRERLAGDLQRTREATGVLVDAEQLEAELAAVRADTLAEVSRAAQLEAAARRERLEADDTADAALAAAAASESARIAGERDHDAEARARAALVAAGDARRAASDALARAEAAAAAQAAAEGITGAGGERAQEALARAAQAHDGPPQRSPGQEAELARGEALEQARRADGDRSAAEQDAQQARKETSALSSSPRRRSAARNKPTSGRRRRSTARTASRLARADRCEFERELAEQRAARQAADLEHGRAQPRSTPSSACEDRLGSWPTTTTCTSGPWIGFCRFDLPHNLCSRTSASGRPCSLIIPAVASTATSRCRHAVQHGPPVRLGFKPPQRLRYVTYGPRAGPSLPPTMRRMSSTVGPSTGLPWTKSSKAEATNKASKIKSRPLRQTLTQ
jgi:hypothetical protein